MACTQVGKQLHGQLVISALGGSARELFDDLDAAELQDGVFLPHEHEGYYHVSAEELILRVLERRFVHVKAGMLQTRQNVL